MLWKSENETPNLKFFCVLTVFFFSDSRFSPWGWPQICACTHIIQNILVLAAQTRGDFSLFLLTLCSAIVAIVCCHKKTLQIAVEWLHQGCDGDLAADFFSILALVVFLVTFILKSAPKSSFSLWRRDPVLELQFLLPLWSLCTLKLLCVKASLCRKIRV